MTVITDSKQNMFNVEACLEYEHDREELQKLGYALLEVNKGLTRELEKSAASNLVLSEELIDANRTGIFDDEVLILAAEIRGVSKC